MIQAEVEAREASENVKVNPVRQAVPGQAHCFQVVVKYSVYTVVLQ